MLKKIVSGGQTGVDRGALDAALAAGFPCGGWCPEGRLAEDGIIPARYPLVELLGGGYEERTLANVRDSDGTFVIHFGAISGGTALTVEACKRLGRPYHLVDAAETDASTAVEVALAFVAEQRVEVLNVAGPRASNTPAAAGYTERVVSELLVRCREAARRAADSESAARW
jgi:hypothetical protein